MGIPEYEARRFEGRIRDGGVLISVHCDSADWVRRAKEIMAHAGGQDIGVESEKSGDFSNADKPLPRARSTAAGATAADDELYTERPTRPRGGTVIDEVKRTRGAGAGAAATDEVVYADRTTRIRTSADDDVTK
jgi:hypothetical protein